MATLGRYAEECHDRAPLVAVGRNAGSEQTKGYHVRRFVRNRLEQERPWVALQQAWVVADQVLAVLEDAYLPGALWLPLLRNPCAFAVH